MNQVPLMDESVMLTDTSRQLNEARRKISDLEDRLADARRQVDESWKELTARRAVMTRLLHQRRCRDCGHVDFYVANVAPYCLCYKCSSQDTRRTAGKPIEEYAP